MDGEKSILLDGNKKLKSDNMEKWILSEAAGVYLVMGVIERDSENSGGTLYCSVVFIGPDGSLLGKHRKLKPTAAERIVWGEGDGSTLPVLDTPYGKIGALICWETICL